MKTCTLIRWTLFLALFGLVAPMICAEDNDKTSDAARKAFIDSFVRDGMSTTPGDAMMLRILVETRNAQHGVRSCCACVL